MVATWILTTGVSAILGYRLGLRSQIAAKRLDVKAAMLPLIETFIARGKGDIHGWLELRHDCMSLLHDPAVKMKILLSGRKRKRFIEAWESFFSITTEDFHFPQYNESGEKTEKMRQLFLARLNALHQAVEDC